jgi:hypothetical protein
MLVSGPAGSGKGVLPFVRMLGETIQKQLLENYRKELAEFKSMQEEGNEENDTTLTKPTMKKFFIPADNTSAKLKQSMGDNGNLGGIVFDTEADTLSDANKSQHGQFSHLYRKAFQHEPIEYERKGNNEYMSIERSALSVLISGTPQQVENLLHDVENGLTSRFAFYSFKESSGWKEVFPASSQDLGVIFKSEGIRLADMVKHYLFDHIDAPESDIEFSLTNDQKQRFHDKFTQKEELIIQTCGNEVAGSIHRMGVILFRIAMILTVMRKTEQLDTDAVVATKIYCEDADFEIANSIVDCLLHHMVNVFFQIKGGKQANVAGSIKEVYFDRLPEEFSTAQATEVAKLIQFPWSTAEKYLSRLADKGKRLVRVRKGEYKKVA